MTETKMVPKKSENKKVETIEERWTKIAEKILVGRKIVAVGYMSKTVADARGWYSRPVVLVLDDGNIIYPSSDDEGNEAGSLFTSSDNDPVLPVI